RRHRLYAGRESNSRHPRQRSDSSPVCQRECHSPFLAPPRLRVALPLVALLGPSLHKSDQSLPDRTERSRPVRDVPRQLNPAPAALIQDLYLLTLQNPREPMPITKSRPINQG